MRESEVDIDTLGTLRFEHFEKIPSEGCSSDLGSAGSSPSHLTDDLESPIRSPDQVSSPEDYSDCWNSHSEEELVGKVPSRKGKAKRSREPNENVLKRNERERKRVKLISEGFSTLRKHVLIQPTNRKLPKLQILRRAISYIKAMQKMLEESDMQLQMKTQRERDVCPQVMQACQQVYRHEQVSNCIG